jgi:Flp pilus assembly protein TadG
MPSQRFLSDQKGTIAIIFALGLVPLAAFTAVAVDYTKASRVKADLQAAADAAALAGVVRAVPERASVATAVFNANTSGASAFYGVSITQASTSPDVSRLRVDASATVPNTLGPFIGGPTTQVRVSATAVVPTSTGTPQGGCFYVLDPGTNGALRVNGGSAIDAQGCVAHVHSAINHSFILNSGARYNVDRVCVRGTALVNPGGRTGQLDQNCNPDNDPFASSRPSVPATLLTSCTFNNLVFNPQPTPIVLSPGSYCGNTIFNGGAAQVTFSPGLYVIRGPMIFNSGSVVRGTDVTFHFANDGTFMMNGQMEMYLDAPTSGTYAGWLMMQDPALPKRNFIFNNEQGQRLSGIIWLPTQDIQFNSRSRNDDRDRVSVVSNTAILNAQARWRLDPRPGSTSAPVVAGAARLER